MLPQAVRMRDGETFRHTLRRGASSTSGSVVARVVLTTEPDVQVGLIVGKKVGNAVARNRVKRRVRHALRSELSTLPVGARVVIRALPGAATSAALPHETRDAVARATRRAVERSPAPAV
ncbi:MAG: ribonuclease P protein component [Aeromicrobium sp.]|uniref:ribonuclease P protein component n=1 Tax=Aeromicrobium sp. TaxID=1871063 RepID=UPI0039E4BDBE